MMIQGNERRVGVKGNEKESRVGIGVFAPSQMRVSQVTMTHHTSSSPAPLHKTKHPINRAKMQDQAFNCARFLGHQSIWFVS